MKSRTIDEKARDISGNWYIYIYIYIYIHNIIYREKTIVSRALLLVASWLSHWHGHADDLLGSNDESHEEMWMIWMMGMESDGGGAVVVVAGRGR
jgi:hypothetical protein